MTLVNTQNRHWLGPAISVVIGALVGPSVYLGIARAIECSYALRAELVEVRLLDGAGDPASQSLWQRELSIGAIGDDLLETSDGIGGAHTSMLLMPEGE